MFSFSHYCAIARFALMCHDGTIAVLSATALDTVGVPISLYYAILLVLRNYYPVAIQLLSLS